MWHFYKSYAGFQLRSISQIQGASYTVLDQGIRMTVSFYCFCRVFKIIRGGPSLGPTGCWGQIGGDQVEGLLHGGTQCVEFYPQEGPPGLNITGL